MATIEEIKQEKKTLREELRDLLNSEKQEREKIKSWSLVYVAVRKKTVELNKDVKAGELSPKEAIVELRKVIPQQK